jgi:prefoldin subunit 5
MTSALMVKQDVVIELNEKIDELSQTINMLADENTVMRDKIAIGQWDASEIEKIDAEQTIKDLREQIRILEADNKAMRQSRDMFQNRNSELMKTVKSLQNKLKKLDPQ